MDYLPKEAFVHVNICRLFIAEGHHYDLLGPYGELIVSYVWEALMQPGRVIAKHV